MDTKSFNPSAVMARIQGTKNYLKTPEDDATASETYYETQIAEIYELYQEKLPGPGYKCIHQWKRI